MSERIVGWSGRPIKCERCNVVHTRFVPPQAYQRVPWTDHVKDAAEILLGALALLAFFVIIGWSGWVLFGMRP